MLECSGHLVFSQRLVEIQLRESELEATRRIRPVHAARIPDAASVRKPVGETFVGVGEILHVVRRNDQRIVVVSGSAVRKDLLNVAVGCTSKEQ